MKVIEQLDGDLISNHIKLSGITAQDLADKLEISEGMVYKMIRGGIPKAPVFLKLSKILGVEPEKLLVTFEIQKKSA